MKIISPILLSFLLFLLTTGCATTNQVAPAANYYAYPNSIEYSNAYRDMNFKGYRSDAFRGDAGFHGGGGRR